MSEPQGSYLDRIVADVRRRLAEPAGRSIPASPSARTSPVRSLRRAIEARAAFGEVAIIAEVKRRSPSVGAIQLDVDPAAQAAAYAAGGAAGISVLTEPDHFGGSLDDLVAVRASIDAPVLRKDFIVAASQLDDALAAGADAVLLIAALHEALPLQSLVEHATAIGLEVLMEIHDERDLERALATTASLIGINNRDLRSFQIDLAVTERLAPLVPDDRLVIAESGVRTEQDAARLRATGVDALLVGEALMRAGDPGGMLRSLARADSSSSAGAAP